MPSARTGKAIEKISWKGKKATLTIGKEKVILSENAFAEFRLYEGKEISESELKKIKDYAALDDLYGYALRLLSMRAYTAHEIRVKLQAKEEGVEPVRKVIFRLKKNGLLDDEAYAKAYLEDAYEIKLIGEKKIRYELDKRGIEMDIINGLPFSETKEKEGAMRFLKLLEKRYSAIPNAAKRNKAINGLCSRGYSLEIAKEVASTISPNGREEEISLLEKDFARAKARYARKYQGYELRQKLTAYLLGKGYSYEDIKHMEEDEYENDC